MTGLTEAPPTPNDVATRSPQPRKSAIARPSIPLGTIMGIPIHLDYSWFLIFGLLTWTLATTYYPSQFKNWSPALYWSTAAISAVLLFVSVVLHELGHSFVALRFHIPVRSITLFVFGGVARIGSDPASARAEFLIAIAGPIVSLILAVLCALAQPALTSIEPLFGLAKYLAYLNFGLALFNLIPGFPLDGGRVLRALVWGVTKNMRQATLVAANAGRFFGFLFIFAGVWRIFSGDLSGAWIAFIGWFLENAASAQVHQVTSQGLLMGHSVSQAMNNHCLSIPADLTLQDLVDQHVFGAGRRCFLVRTGAETVGLMTLHRIGEVPRGEWRATSAAQVMLPIDDLKSIGPDTELWAALQLMDRDGVNQLPVVTGREVVGMLSREDVITFLGALKELGDMATMRRAT